MRVKAEVEVRGKERHTNKKGEESIILRVEDIETGEAFSFVDKDLKHFDDYKRGTEGTLTLELKDRGRYGLGATVEKFEKKS